MLFRSSFLESVTQQVVDDTVKRIAKNVDGYLTVTTGNSHKDAILTSDLNNVIGACTKNQRVYIAGRKGCGKTYALAVLFALCHKNSLNCLFLTSFEIVDHVYFQDFIKSNFAEEKWHQYFSKLKSEGAIAAITSVLNKLKGKELIIFADLSIQSSSGKSATALCDIILCEQVLQNDSVSIQICYILS